MTILATAMGCTFLIVLASVGFGLHKSILKDMMEIRLVTQIDVHGRSNEDGNYLPITDQDITYFESIDQCESSDTQTSATPNTDFHRLMNIRLIRNIRCSFSIGNQSRAGVFGRTSS